MHGGDEKAVDAIIAQKEAVGAVQEHPDNPDLKMFNASRLNIKLISRCACPPFRAKGCRPAQVHVDLGRREEEETKDELSYGSKIDCESGGEARFASFLHPSFPRQPRSS